MEVKAVRPVRPDAAECSRCAREVAFIDPGLDAVEVLRAGLRREIEPILLEASSPAPLQIAQALRGRADLDAIHILAHGSPGSINFAAGAVTADTVRDHADELALVGRALGEDGQLLVWSCHAGAGAEGAALTRALKAAGGAPVTVAQSLIGHAALGGTWTISSDIAGAAAPLTPSAQEGYFAVAATQTTSNGTTVDNLNVLDSSNKNNLGGVEIVSWTEAYNALFGSTNATQTLTIQSAFNSGSLLLTFKTADNKYYTTYRDVNGGYHVAETSSELGLYGTSAISTADFANTDAGKAQFVAYLNSRLSANQTTEATLTAVDIDGSAGKDVIQGINSNVAIHNIIQGGAGADVLQGGLGSDFFVYKAATDAPASATSWDQITNFSSTQGDKIDLRALGQLAWNGTASGAANSVWYTTSGTSAFVYADTNGDGTADLKIELQNVTTLAASDFLLNQTGAISTITGTAKEGQVLTAGIVSDADGISGTVGYQWQRLGTDGQFHDVVGQTGSTLSLGYTTAGDVYRVKATYTDAQSQQGIVVYSAATAAVQDTDRAGSIAAISGSATEGQTLTAGAVTDPDGNPSSVSYQWQKLGTDGQYHDVSGATASTLALSFKTAGDVYRVVASYTDGDNHTVSVFSDPTSAVVDTDRAGSIAAISGSATEGQTLTAGAVTDPDGNPSSVSYQWQVKHAGDSDFSNVSGATSSSFDLGFKTAGDVYRVVASYTDGDNHTVSVFSDPTSAVVDTDRAGSIAAISGSATEGQTLTAGAVTDPDGNPSSVSYQWQVKHAGDSDFSNVSGATSSSFDLGFKTAGDVYRVVASYTDGDNHTVSVFSDPTSAVVDTDRAGSIAAISGSATEGQTLTAGAVTDPDGNPSSVSYQWQKLGTDGQYHDVSGATASTLALSYTTAGDVYRVNATYTDADGHTVTVSSAPTAAVTDTDRAGSIAAISGSATEGQTLTAGAVTDPDGNPSSVSYQWQKLGTDGQYHDVSGATASTLALSFKTAGDVYRVVASYTDGDNHTVSVFSDPTSAVVDTDRAGSIAAISGSATEGQTLTAGAVTDPDGNPSSVSYQWQKLGTDGQYHDVSGATASTLALSFKTAGDVYRVVASYTDGDNHTVSVFSDPTSAVVDTDRAGSIAAISGSATEGQTLTAGAVTDPDGNPSSVSYQWQKLGTDGQYHDVSGATASTLALSFKTAGDVYRVVASYTDGDNHTVSVFSDPTSAVVDTDRAGSIAAISGSATEGQTLTAGAVTDPDGNPSSVSYQWQVKHAGDSDFSNVSGATSSSFDLGFKTAGDVYRVVASYTDGDNHTVSVFSDPTSAVVDTDRAGSIAAISGSATEGQTLTAGAVTDPDGNPSSVSYQWQVKHAGDSDFSNVSGATSSSFDLGFKTAGDVYRVVASYTDGDNHTVSVFSDPTSAVVDTDRAGSIAAISGSATEGQTLTAGAVTDPDGNPSSVSYQWQVKHAGDSDFSNVSGATSSSFDLGFKTAGDVYRVVASYTDGDNHTVSVFSDPTSAVVDTDRAGSIAAISGSATEGQTLTAGAVTDPDGNPSSVSYQWQKLGTDGQYHDVSGATASTLALGYTTAGDVYRVNATYTDADGHTVTVSSAPTAAVTDTDRAGSIAAISGSATEGQTLTAGAVTDPDGNPSSVSYQWQKLGTDGQYHDVSGATASTLALGYTTAGDVYRVVASYTDGDNHTVSVFSDPTSAVVDTDRAGSIAAISGSATEGQTLTAGAVTDPDGNPSSVSYQWQKLGTDGQYHDVSGATASTLALGYTTAGDVYRVNATYTDADGHTVTVSSAPTAAVTDTDRAGSIAAISGSATEGQTLTAGAVTDPDGNPSSVSYQWQVKHAGDSDFSNVSGATSSSFDLGFKTAGDVYRVVASYTDGDNHTVSVFSDPTSAVVDTDRAGSIAAISGSATEGQTLTAGAVTDPDGNPSSVSYQWQVKHAGDSDFSNVSGATSSSFDLGFKTAGDVYRVVASYTDGDNHTVSVFSDPTSAVVDTDRAGSIAAISGSATEGQTLTAGAVTDPDGNPSSVSYQWQKLGTDGQYHDVSGATASTLALSFKTAGDVYRVVASYTDGDNHTVSVFSDPTSAVVDTDRAGSIAAISGSATEGQTLTAGAVTDPDGNPSSVSYQWQKLGTDGQYHDVSGATASTLALGYTTAGDVYRVNATYTDADGHTVTVSSAPTAAVTDTDRAGSIAAISGSATEGQTLTAGAVTDPDGNPSSVSYQWQKLGTDGQYHDVSGATASTLALGYTTAGDVYRVNATYTDADGHTVTVSSAPTAAVTDTDRAGSIAAISGSATEGQTLTAGAVTDPDGNPSSVSYQWQKLGTDGQYHDVSGATASTLALSYTTAGDVYRVNATYTDADGHTVTVSSAPTAAVTDTDRAGSIAAISGSATEGQTLTAGAVTDPDGNPSSVSYQWQKLGTDGQYHDVSGATASTLALSFKTAGDVYRVVASYTDGDNHTVSVFSDPTSAVVDTDRAGSIAAISGSATEGQTLTAGAVTDPDGNPSSVSYQWQKLGTDGQYHDVSGATASTLALSFKTAGDVYRVVASYTDGDNHTVSVFSDPTSAVVDTDRAGSIAAISGSATEGQTLTAGAVTDPDGNPSSVSYQWQKLGTDGQYHDVSGATASTLALSFKTAGDVYRVVASYTDGDNHTVSVFSDPTSAVVDTDRAGSIAAISGSATEGQTLTAGAVTDPDGNPSSVSYQWQKLGTDGQYHDVSGATASTLALGYTTAGDVYRVNATYTDADGHTVTVSSAPTAAVTDTDRAGSIAAISGSATEGQTLTAGAVTDPDGNPSSVSYQWQKLGTDGQYHDVSGATASTLALGYTTAGDVYRVNATYTDADGHTVTVSSAPTAAVTDTDRAGSIAAISGSATEGQTLTAGAVTDPDGNPSSVSYQWQVKHAGDSDFSNVSGATSSSFDLGFKTAGDVYRVVASYTDGDNHTVSVFSDPTSAVVDTDRAGSIAAISGSATEGQTLTAGAVTDPDGNPSSVSYQWQKLGTDGQYHDVSGATASTLALGYTTAGDVYRVNATYTDADGHTVTVSSAPTAAVTDTDRAGSIAAISGSATEGQTLTAGAVTDPDGNPSSVSYQWQVKHAGDSDFSNVSGATSSSFDLGFKTAGDVYRVVASYTDGDNHTVSVFSDPTSAVVDTDRAGSIAAISGSATEGQTLTAGAVTDPDGNPSSVSYQWQKLGTDGQYHDVSGATASTLALGYTTAGDVYRVNATYTDADGHTVTVSSAPTAAVTDTDRAGSIAAISGSATEGQTLTAGAVTDPDGNPSSVSYQWQVKHAGDSDFSNVSGATSSSFDLGFKTAGDVYRVVASYTDGDNHTVSVFSDPTSAVVDTDRAGSIAAISGSATEGQTLTAGAVTDPDGNPSSTTYKWQSSTNGTTWTDVSGATASAYTLGYSDSGKQFRVVASYTDGQGHAGTATSAATASVTDVDRAGSIGAVTGTATEGQTLTAGAVTDPDGNPSSTTYKWQSSTNGTTWTDVSGATASAYTLGYSDSGKQFRVVASYTDGQGHAGTATSAATASVTDVDRAGSVSISASATGQGKTSSLTASLSDADGVPSSGVTWIWERSTDGVNWQPGKGTSTGTGSTSTYSPAGGQNPETGGIYFFRATASYTDLQNHTASLTAQTATKIAPAGTAGEPINLALGDPTGKHAEVTVTVTDLPSDWTLSNGMKNADGSWTVTTTDLASLSVTTPATYTGAAVLNVTMAWTNADGTMGTTTIADNVEAYAKGSPIFAWSGHDTLTGSTAADLFVFGNPIGEDKIYSFDVAADKIDLIGYSGFTSFTDVQAHLADDSAGNAVITLADGQTITLDHVHASDLSAANFVFDQPPAVTNSGTMSLSDGAMLPLSGSVTNTGTIELNSTGGGTLLQVIDQGITLTGGGTVKMSDDDGNAIAGTKSTVTLTNVDNTISGAGQLGGGSLTLTNEASGKIVADGSHALVIDTGTTVVENAGTLAATGSGGLVVKSALDNTGTVWAHGGNVTIEGAVTGSGTTVIDGNATVEFGTASSAHVDLGQGDGTLKLDDSFHFNGSITGFGAGDQIDLADLLFGTGTSASYAANAQGTGGVLTVSDGVHTAALNLQGTYDAAAFKITEDSAGHAQVMYDPLHLGLA
ncbi:DUF4347 domain-containing protein [Methylobacterium nodulans]|uniref:DUF4347 domain-containing protein n=1 Tax=Methylobacterium nodulans (strain LMG 21967 / CNCM I-2342 / ORS 2060) TaxID=460265 RepID=B8ICV0_METNO|nr:DUF4347 domain-containing protein [Methylobacterium nodulans]ACL57511.1 hypothetical protein Mnod_2545 [Methylobacterium nodulans ORS 2060]